MLPDPILTQAQREQMRQEKLMRAYRDLFGNDPARRSEIQNLVWEDLQIAGYFKKSGWIPDRTGQVCPYRAAIAEGRRSLFLYIQANVDFVSEVQQTQTQQ